MSTNRSLAARFVLAMLLLAFHLSFLTPTFAQSDAEAQNDSQAAADHAVVEALLRLPVQSLNDRPNQEAAVKRYLSRNVGSNRYFDVANRLQVTGNPDDLLAMLFTTSKSSTSVAAGRMLVRDKEFEAVQQSLGTSSPEQASTALSSLAGIQHPRVQSLLQEIVRNTNGNRQTRIAAADALGRSEPGQQFLLQMAKEGEIPEDIRFTVTNSLFGAKSKTIRSEAEKLLPSVASKTSEKIPSVGTLARARGNASQGMRVFNTNGTCIKCHKVQDQGKDVGPDLSEIGSKLSREDMYVAILNPSAAISHNYETYTLLDADGQIYSGLLISQTDEEVVIRDSEGIDHKVASDEVETLRKQATSLMPADLQKGMSLQDLKDVVEYMQSLKKEEDKSFLVLEATQDHDPSKAIAGFEIDEELDVELFAAEPRLLSPTSIDVDAYGRVWVCEAVNYRHFRNTHPERKEGDRILVLEDTDGDGQADQETVFYQSKEIDSPHGVCVIGSTIIVSAGENVILFTDTDNDLKPDSKEYLFTGISGVQHDHGIHAFGVGPDGKLYFNFGNEGKQLRGPNGETIVDKAGNRVEASRAPYQEGMVFRCNPDGSELETLGWNFRNNWEVCVDSFGTIWQSDNDDDGNKGTRINFVMEFGNYGYKDELTGAGWRSPRTGLESEIPLQHWHLNDPGVIPNILQTGAGSPTGICVYEGTLLPEKFQNQVIHTDPGPNVVRAYPVQREGAGFRASITNLVKGVQDPWFRPVDVCTAPDGSLFVADWYDPGVGGHRMGDAQHGRIFRIVPKGHKGYQTPTLDLDSPDGVIDALQSPNPATRYLAQQAITSMGSKVVPALEELAQSPILRMRARALWQLAIVAASEKYIEQALTSPHDELRIVGIRMARQHGLDVIPIVERLKSDPSKHVLRELAIALRHHQSNRAPELWAELALRHDGKDRWYLEALGIAADRQWDAYFEAWLAKVGDDWNSPAGRDIVWRCRSPKACRYLAEIIQNTSSVEEQNRYFRAFDFHDGDSKKSALQQLLTAAN